MLTSQRTDSRPLRASARGVALDVLDAVFASRPAPADEAFNNHRGLARLETRDRAFARLLYATVLRHLGEIDKVWRNFVKYRPHEPRIVNILRLGTGQLLFLSTPPHAAVSETVGLATGSLRRQAPMVNAVLRQIAQNGRQALASLDPIALNTPRWLFDSWVEAYGAEGARTIAQAHSNEPPLDLNAKRDAEYWATAVGGDLLPHGIIRRRSGSVIEALPGYAEGAWWVQDAAAALPVLCLGDVRGKSVLDIGAAPGGKTAQLAARGAKVTAIERSPARAEILARNLGRLQLDAEIVVADAVTWRPQSPFDAILLDAPCTATGTIRRHPDVTWTKTPKDLGRLQQAQSAMFDAAIDMSAPDGIVVYATCSLQPEEGEQQIARMIARRSDVIVEAIESDQIKGVPANNSASGSIRTFPYHWAELGGLDGFFIARVRKK